MAEPIFTVANQLTLLRMALTPVLVVFIAMRQLRWALVVFVIAGLTDLFDGFIARHGHQLTRIGAMLDPVADKLLLGSCYVALTWTGDLFRRMPVWLTIIVLSRDAMIVVSVAIVNLTLGHRVFPPSFLGKLSTASQILTVGVVLVVNTLSEAPHGMRYLFATTAALTIVSALHYVYLGSAQGAETAHQ